MSIDFRFFFRLSSNSSSYCDRGNFNYMTLCSYKIYYTAWDDQKKNIGLFFGYLMTPSSAHRFYYDVLGRNMIKKIYDA
jgi:hypothetical protein